MDNAKYFILFSGNLFSSFINRLNWFIHPDVSLPYRELDFLTEMSNYLIKTLHLMANNNCKGQAEIKRSRQRLHFVSSK